MSKPKVKQAIILVTVHEDGEHKASSTLSAADKVKDLNVHVVDIWPDAIVPIMDTTAHEFGHVLSSLFETAANNADPRRHPTPMQRLLLNAGLVPPEPMQRMVDAETEAWDFAQKMFADLKPESREEALKTYQQGLEMWKANAAQQDDAVKSAA